MRDLRHCVFPFGFTVGHSVSSEDVPAEEEDFSKDVQFPSEKYSIPVHPVIAESNLKKILVLTGNENISAEQLKVKISKIEARERAKADYNTVLGKDGKVR